MLMRFSISNFMSFGYKLNPEEYHLYAGRSEQHKERIMNYKERKVLKFSSIYGANASGKTNLIRAIDTGRDIILNTMEDIDCQDKFCKSDYLNAERPTLFEYEFTVGEKCFAYGFTVNLKHRLVFSEWLYEMKSAEEHVLFERVAENDAYYFDEKLFAAKENGEQFHFFIKDANRIRTTLLLYEIKRRKMEEEDFEIFNKIFDWFRYKLVVIYPETKIGASYFWFGSDNKKLVNILKYLDTGITDYDMRVINEAAFKEYFPDEGLAEKFLRKPSSDNRTRSKSILNFGETLFELDYDETGTKRIAKLVFQHGSDAGKYEYGEESDGTQRLIELLDVILNDDEDKVFVIDELDRSLHPQMTIKFVETFLKFSVGKTTQLIITTHESNLMDLSILRRDEIWFAEKEQDNNTSLYTLEKFKIRYDKVVSKDYLAGRYGAVPVFKDFEYVWGRE
ncbi:MAG: ATP-binding protein [Lachnospiraceae bacterium]|nr:ATP-binding protein [Lachnospiraceae bacterium]